MDAPSVASMGLKVGLLVQYRTLRTLVENGHMTAQQAAKVMTDAANDIRSGTEDDSTAAAGEAAARGCEGIAEWLLRLPGPSGGKGP